MHIPTSPTVRLSPTSPTLSPTPILPLDTVSTKEQTNDQESINTVLESESLIAKLIDISKEKLTIDIRGQRGGGIKRTGSELPDQQPLKVQKNEKIQLANMLIELSGSGTDTRGGILKRTTTIEGAEGLSYYLNLNLKKME